MTNKQQKIINAAIDLFSKNGFNATSTIKIAKKAGVSEGLIFRHFKNKEGLIQSILNLNETRIKSKFNPILDVEDAKQVIKETLELPFKIDTLELVHWRLHFKLKWELNQDNSKTMKQLEVVLIKAFSKLKYKKPQLESELILRLIESLIASVVLGEI